MRNRLKTSLFEGEVDTVRPSVRCTQKGPSKQGPGAEGRTGLLGRWDWKRLRARATAPRIFEDSAALAHPRRAPEGPFVPSKRLLLRSSRETRQFCASTKPAGEPELSLGQDAPVPRHSARPIAATVHETAGPGSPRSAPRNATRP